MFGTGPFTVFGWVSYMRRAATSPEVAVKLNTIERVTVSVDEAAAMLGISRTSAYEHIRTGHLPAIRMGRRLLIPLKAIGDLLGDLVSDHTGATGAAPEKQRRSVGQS